MFTDIELKTTKLIINIKIHDLLNSCKGTDADYIRELQTLIKLKSAAEKQLADRETE